MPTLVLLMVGVAALIASLDLVVVDDRRPGPGLWPLLVSVSLIATASLVAARPNLRLAEKTSRSQVRLVVTALALMVGFALLLPMVGIVSTCWLVGAVWLRGLNREPWLLSLLTPLITGFTLYAVLVLALNVPVPVDAFLPR